MLHQKAEFLTGLRSLESVELCKMLTIGELTAAITAKISEILKEECVRVIDNFARRLQVCLQRREGHLEHILERT